MGLIKQSDWLRPRHALRKQYESVVVDNKDPRMLGRIKCEILGLMEVKYIPVDDLPWVSPQYPAELGNDRHGSDMHIPEMGSSVLVEFPTENIYQPVYRWRVPNRKTRPTDFQSEYPHRYGSADRNGNKTIINKLSGHASKETRLQDGTQTFHDSERSTTLTTDPYGTIIEIDRPNQRLFAKFGGVEITVSPDGVSINTPSLMINSEDAMSLLSGTGLDISSMADGHGIASYIEQLANSIEEASNGG
jgi:hypothetical protein